MKLRLPNCERGVHSLRGKLTLANVGLLALGIVMATAVSLMGMRHYLLAQVYRDLQNPEASARELAEFEKLSKSGSDKAQDHDALDDRK